jgi:hypothetical protein
MTAEIAIMNSSAVALASDSAVTGNTPQGDKIYNTAEKMFRLSKYHPVGIMLYGAATFMDVTWETIIKEYRDKLGDKNYDTLELFSEDFVSFLVDSDYLFPESIQKRNLKGMLFGYFSFVNEQIKKRVEGILEENKKITKRDASKIAADVIKKNQIELEKRKWIKGTSSEKYMRKFIEDYNEIIEEAIVRVFEKLPIYKKDKVKLKKIAGLLVCKDFFPNNISGLVIAGFGKKDIFPKLQSLKVEGIINNKLKYNVDILKKIDFVNNASIIPFAQQEMVHTFISGIDPSLRETQSGYLKSIFNKYPDLIIKGIKKISDTEKKKLKRKMREASENLYKTFVEDTKDFIEENYIRPIMSVVTFLPKDELAVMAETFVNLTSFKRKVSLGSETVGGPIDVAVISKGDGFVWIKKKNYFDKDINLRYVASYYRNGGG